MTPSGTVPSSLSIAVVGGGVTGLAAAEALRSRGAAVTIYEKATDPGGLCSGTEIGSTACDRFYHVVLSSDRATLDWIRSLGLGERLVWSDAGSGFFGRGRIAPLATSADFLRFPFLSLPQKLRLGLGLVLAARVHDPAGPASVTAEAWLQSKFGAVVTDRIWMPLLRSKLGTAASRASATLIWASIRRLFSARRGPAARERWGGLRGGVRGLVAAAAARLRADGVEIRTACPVRRVEPKDDGTVLLETDAGPAVHDAVLVTAPGPEAAGLLPPGSPADAWAGVEYLGVTAVLVLLRRPLSPFYVLNLLDESLPFTGIIEMTNVLPISEFGDRHLVYLPKYAAAGDSPSGTTDLEITASFLAGLKVVFPFLRDDDILQTRIERAAWAQPLLPPGPVDPFPLQARRPARGVFVVNSALISRSPNNIDASLRLGREAAQSVLAGSGWERRVEG
jgi:protoporphyrinogen oxidase